MIDRARYRTGTPPAPGLYKAKCWYHDQGQWSVWTGTHWCDIKSRPAEAEKAAYAGDKRPMSNGPVRWKPIPGEAT